MNWFLYAICAMGCFGGMQLFFKALSVHGIGVAVTLTVLSFITGALYFLWAKKAGDPFQADGTAWKLLLGASILSFAGNMFALRSISDAPNPGYATAVFSSTGIVVTLLSVPLFGSVLSGTKLFGVLLCVAGSFVLALG